ncbi:MAG: nitric oxide reductase [Bacteroidia bacterium]|jgi:nitric oxide reductase subunit B|nr:cbb3-type cytochrome c oxidase subunit I [Paludibacteraceae bacterium]MBP6634264.1 cbb3-type cytochrome c oxidase subunit I [Paludibacter sp.]NCB68625.1 nitric oxide reductase [Bacteroidia bacterium]MBP8022996.1 cbb3-type cytochrome c oxidase subunit I [Paludibacter sp.]MBP8782773.1 cbb3-type cytochrome c oxidase subunit I [Paludibacter sp.]
MKQSFLDKFMSRKGLATSFWIIALIMVSALIYYTANLQKEVPPIPQEVKSVNGEVLYTYDDVIAGKAYFQQFDLTDWGSMLGMGAYIGPDFSTDMLHYRAVFLYDFYGMEIYGKKNADLTEVERGAVKERVKQDVKRQTQLLEGTTVYTEASAQAYKWNVEYIKNLLVNGDPERGYRGGVILPEEAEKIAAFFDWGQLVASSLRPGTERTWSNNWPGEPLIDQDLNFNAHKISLWEFLILWTLTIVVIYLSYEYLFKKEPDDKLEDPIQITGIFRSQKKLLKYIPIVAGLFVVQLFMGGYLAHLYTEPSKDFLISQDLLPFNVIRSMHTQIAILWVAVGWLVGGLLIAPWVANKDHKYPWLVDVLWASLLVVAVGSMIGLYMGATGQMRETWFWLGNEGRELINLGRVWDIGLVVGLVFWFLLIISLIRKSATNNPIVSTIIWSAFAIATLYMAGMMPVHKIMPNYTVDDYYRWWVIHLWVELTFELFAAGVIAFFTVSLGLISHKVAVKVMFFELFLISLSGTLGVGHHYFWQGLDEYWIAIGGIFSALEPLPLALMIIEAMKNKRERVYSGENFNFGVPFMWIAGSAVLNWIGAGFFGMMINTPTISYYSHGTYLIMPHGHVALLGAFGYISIAFLYMTSRTNALANNLKWDDKLSKYGFWILTIGALLYAIPTYVVGMEQTRVAMEDGYFAARLRETVESMKGWMWARTLPDGMMILGGLIVFYDLLQKTFLAKKLK